MARYRLLQTCYLGDALRPAGTIYDFPEGARPPAEVAVPFSEDAVPTPAPDEVASVQRLLSLLTPTQRQALAAAVGSADPDQRLAEAAAGAGVAAPVFPALDPAVLLSQSPPSPPVLNPAAPPPLGVLPPGVVPSMTPQGDDPLAI